LSDTPVKPIEFRHATSWQGPLAEGCAYLVMMAIVAIGFGIHEWTSRGVNEYSLGFLGTGAGMILIATMTGLVHVSRSRRQRIVIDSEQRTVVFFGFRRETSEGAMSLRMAPILSEFQVPFDGIRRVGAARWPKAILGTRMMAIVTRDSRIKVWSTIGDFDHLHDALRLIVSDDPEPTPSEVSEKRSAGLLVLILVIASVGIGAVVVYLTW
jgi:hypothetical protein